MSDHSPASMEHCLRALSLIYTRVGTPSEQDDQDFKLLLQGESEDGLIDLLMTVSGIVALILEEIDTLEPALSSMRDDGPIDKALTVLDSLRDVFINQAVHESA